MGPIGDFGYITNHSGWNKRKDTIWINPYFPTTSDALIKLDTKSVNDRTKTRKFSTISITDFMSHMFKGNKT
jgi:hypothetical protein